MQGQERGPQGCGADGTAGYRAGVEMEMGKGNINGTRRQVEKWRYHDNPDLALRFRCVGGRASVAPSHLTVCVCGGGGV